MRVCLETIDITRILSLVLLFLLVRSPKVLPRFVYMESGLLAIQL